MDLIARFLAIISPVHMPARRQALFPGLHEYVGEIRLEPADETEIRCYAYNVERNGFPNAMELEIGSIEIHADGLVRFYTYDDSIEAGLRYHSIEGTLAEVLDYVATLYPEKTYD